jgi:hypothetical protein
MKTKHTPGPWRSVVASAHEFNPDTLRRDIIGKCEFGDAYVAGDISEIDARLISAAPDLLSALQQAYNAIAWDIPGGNLSDEEEEALLDTIRAAIAKAEGRAE